MKQKLGVVVKWQKRKDPKQQGDWKENFSQGTVEKA